ncbi:MAG: hypothetical protein SOV89_06990 [Candidatus Egerieousia sp.]|nr:hypothetical protein [Candidatus Egerieousia sp.]
MRLVAGRGAVAEMLAKAPSGRRSWQDRRCEVASGRAADEEWQTVRRRDGEPSGRDCWQDHRKECKRLNG